jgi:hypothetical protein
MFGLMQRIQKCGRYPVRQEFARTPNMVGHTRRHRWRNQLPASRCSRPSRWHRLNQAPPQALMRQHQVVVRQRQPQMLLHPAQLFAVAVGLARQAPVLLAQSQVLASTKLVLRLVLTDELARRCSSSSRSPNTTLRLTATTCPFSRCLTT